MTAGRRSSACADVSVQAAFGLRRQRAFSVPRGRLYSELLSSALAAAVIAAIVSVVVAAGSVAVTVVTTRATLRRDRERQKAEFQRTMTARLYDRRVAIYPGLFAATDAFRNSRLNTATDLHRHLADAIVEVDRWLATEGGLILSMRAYAQLLELRLAVRRCLCEPADSDQLEQFKHEIWDRKGKLRAAMRADLGLLFDEDSQAQPAPAQ